MALKGREIDLKFCTTQKRRLSSPSILFSNKVKAPYHEIEICMQHPSLFQGTNAKSAPISTEFQDTLDPFKKKSIKMALI